MLKQLQGDADPQETAMSDAFALVSRAEAIIAACDTED